LNQLCDHPLSETALRAAKKQFLGQWAISSDNGESQVLAMGKSLLTHGKIRSREEIRTLIENITSEDILAVAQDLFNPKQLSQLAYI
jgi:predicted Zn-dependent peptidase